MSGVPAVEIVAERSPWSREAWVERVERCQDGVRAALTLDDGTAAVAGMSVSDADWLGVRAGDIVAVSASTTSRAPRPTA